ncbi:MAG: hypothetical protein WB820_18055 [Rhodoplanes sp.]
MDSAGQLQHAHAPKVGHNGGPQADAGSFHVEMVPDGSVLHVYLRDHSDKAISTEGYKGTAVLVIEGKAERISLTPDGENKLKGTAPTPLPAAPKGAVQITTPTGGTVQAKFK